MTPVKSSNIKAVGYDPQSQTMTVEFNSGAKHNYFDVPPEVHAAFIGAESVGKHFHQNIRDAYGSKRVDDD